MESKLDIYWRVHIGVNSDLELAIVCKKQNDSVPIFAFSNQVSKKRVFVSHIIFRSLLEK